METLWHFGFIITEIEPTSFIFCTHLKGNRKTTQSAA